MQNPHEGQITTGSRPPYLCPEHFYATEIFLVNVGSHTDDIFMVNRFHLSYEGSR